MLTVTVYSGAYGTVRAVEEARRLYGPNATVTGMVSSTTGSSYTYEVVIPEEEGNDG